MHKNNLCRLPNKVLVSEESDTISQSSFNSKKCLFNQTKKEPKKQENTNRYFNNFSKAIMAFQPTKKNITNNIINIKTNNNNKTNIKVKNFNFLNILKKNTVLKYEKSIAENSDVFYISCLINKYKTSYKNIDYEYLKQYYIYSDSVKIIPKKAFYYRHHMIFLELPNFKNLYLNNLNRNNGLDKLNIYRHQNYPDKLLKINQQENLDLNNSKESDNKVFDTNVIETLENYSTTMTQDSNIEKINSLTPLEIFRRCCDTNKNKKSYPKLKQYNQSNINKYIKIDNKKNKKNEKEKSIITFSESEISYISKNINDDSIVSIVRNLTKKRTVKYKYNYEKEQKDFQKRYSVKKGVSTSKDNKKVIVYTMKPENEKIIQLKKYSNICANKINSNTKLNTIKKKLTKINSNNINNISKNAKRGVSTSKYNKRQKIIFDVSHQNTLSNNESKKASFVNVPHYTFNEDKKSLCPSIVSKKNKGVLNLKNESCRISNKDYKVNRNLISASYSNPDNNFQDFYSIFLTPKNDSCYRPDTYKQKYLNKQKKNSFIISKNSILFNNTNNTNNTNIMERSQNKSKNADYSHSRSPIISKRYTENRISQKNVIKTNTHKRHMILTDLDQNKLTLSINKINEGKNNNFKKVDVMKTQIVQQNRRSSLNVNRQNKKNYKINFIK